MADPFNKLNDFYVEKIKMSLNIIFYNVSNRYKYRFDYLDDINYYKKSFTML